MKKSNFLIMGAASVLLISGAFLLQKETVKKEIVVHETVKEVVPSVEEIVAQPIENKEILTDKTLIEQIQTLIKEIRESSTGNYENLKKEYFNYNFGAFDWNVGSINGDQFFIELKNVDKSKCNKLIDAFLDAITIKVNSMVTKDCENLNNIQFIFN